jgi:hypothetical protein
MNKRLKELAMEAGFSDSVEGKWPTLVHTGAPLEKFAELIVHRIYAQIAVTMQANMESEEILWCCTHITEKVSSDLGIEDNAQPWGNK